MEKPEQDTLGTGPHPVDIDAELAELERKRCEARQMNDKHQQLVFTEKYLTRAQFLYGSETATPSIFYYALGLLQTEMERTSEAESILRKGIASYTCEQPNEFMLCALVGLQIQVLHKLGRKEDAYELEARPDYIQAKAVRWGAE